MVTAATFLISLVLLLGIGGPKLVRKFLRGYFRGVDVYVIVTLDGRTLAYKNPTELLGHPDEPLDMIPNEILMSDRSRLITTSAGSSAVLCSAVAIRIIAPRKMSVTATRRLERVQ